jgi:hypothetical protein
MLSAGACAFASVKSSGKERTEPGDSGKCNKRAAQLFGNKGPSGHINLRNIIPNGLVSEEPLGKLTNLRFGNTSAHSNGSQISIAQFYYEPLFQTVRELVKAEKKNSLILMTLYSPSMCAGHCAIVAARVRSH